MTTHRDAARPLTPEEERTRRYDGARRLYEIVKGPISDGGWSSFVHIAKAAEPWFRLFDEFNAARADAERYAADLRLKERATRDNAERMTIFEAESERYAAERDEANERARGLHVELDRVSIELRRRTTVHAEDSAGARETIADLRSEAERYAQRAREAEAALREASEFLDHSGNQRAILSGKFTTPSARYEWFMRVRDLCRRALATSPPEEARP